MGATEEDIKEEERISADFKKAKEILERIKKNVPLPDNFSEDAKDSLDRFLFALCLIYVRQLKEEIGKDKLGVNNRKSSRTHK